MDGKDIGHEIEYNCTGMLIDSFNFGNPEKVEEAGPLEIIYGDTRWIEDDCPDPFSEFIFLYPAFLMISHWLTENAELNSLF